MLTALLLSVLSFSQTDTATSVFELSAPSTMSVVSNGVTGTAFFVKNNHTIVTSHSHRLSSMTTSFLSSALTITAHRYDEDSSIDIATYRSEQKSNTFLKLAEQNAAIGTTVFLVGYSSDANLSVTSGMVSSVKRIGDIEILNISLLNGSVTSGTPVLNADGKVIGMICKLPNDDQRAAAISSANIVDSLNGWEFTPEGVKYQVIETLR